jgi:GDP-L-fucose synthase
MVGSAIALMATEQGHEVLGKSSKDLDLCDRTAVFAEIAEAKPDVLIIAAAKVGGIKANSDQPVEFLSINLQIQGNLLDAAHAANIQKVLFLGSSCIYPKFAPQPLTEESLLTSPLEETNEAYAIAKIAGIKLVDAYNKQYGHHWLSAMPTNLYGPRDNFHPEKSHVLPALIQRFHLAKEQGIESATIWGDGTPLREFLHVEDLARACLILAQEIKIETLVNIGSGREVSIKELAQLVSKVVGYSGEIRFDTTKPNGTPRKLLDSSKITSKGWKPEIDLESGIQSSYEWYLANNDRRMTE